MVWDAGFAFTPRLRVCFLGLLGLDPLRFLSTLTNLEAYLLGDEITLEWTLAAGTQSREVSIQIDQGENYLNLWEQVAASQTNLTIDAEMFDEELEDFNLFNTADSYTVTVRIYAEDAVTGQAHSTNYSVIVPGDNSTTEP